MCVCVCGWWLHQMVSIYIIMIRPHANKAPDRVSLHVDHILTKLAQPHSNILIC